MNTEASVLIALPTSILSVEHTLLLKSIRIHQVARWSSIFGVSEVIFYREPSTSISEFNRHMSLIGEHWKYFFTPPYLRRDLIPLTPFLRYVGMLPPIRLNVFDVKPKPRRGEVRIGHVHRAPGGELRALIGDEVEYRVIGDCDKLGITILLVVDEDNYLVKCIDLPVYRGPRLSFSINLREVLDRYRDLVEYIIATDKKGDYPDEKSIRGLRGSTILILFGSPRYDLFEISSQEGFELDKYVDYIWNTIPRQKVVTVRTEEALIITLGIINAFLGGI